MTELSSKPELAQRIKQVAGEVHGCNTKLAEADKRRCRHVIKFVRSRWPKAMLWVA